MTLASGLVIHHFTLLQVRRIACHQPKSNPQTSQALALPHEWGSSDSRRYIQSPPQTSQHHYRHDRHTHVLFSSKSIKKLQKIPISWQNGVPWHNFSKPWWSRKEEAHLIGFCQRYDLAIKLPTLMGSLCFDVKICTGSRMPLS